MMSGYSKNAKLKSLMRQGRNNQKKVVSKLARYKGDLLICLLCKTVLKSDSLWVAHCNSEKHRQLLNEKIQQQKRKREEEELEKANQVEPPQKKRKTEPGLPTDRIMFNENLTVEDLIDERKLTVPDGFFDNKKDEETARNRIQPEVVDDKTLKIFKEERDTLVEITTGKVKENHFDALLDEFNKSVQEDLAKAKSKQELLEDEESSSFELDEVITDQMMEEILERSKYYENFKKIFQKAETLKKSVVITDNNEEESEELSSESSEEIMNWRSKAS
eukprot:TRINITY_DN9809_c0_g1_i1.p1 TRINITY_DN9809_c0_g1~~TRINITY_DN9809_c0_g1_i1.p1  ORF type:complete len:276 (+),score=78.89 TRINITY_DN9809_c0_g1_i1:6-833(+)